MHIALCGVLGGGLVVGLLPCLAAGVEPGAAAPPREYQPAGQTAWDFWFAKAGDTYHAFYLQAPATVAVKWGTSTVGHAISRDLVTWQEHGEVLRANPPGQWNDRCIATGSVWRLGDEWLMLFTGAGTRGGIGLATSRDLMAWTRVGDGPVTFDYRPFEVPRAAYWQDHGFAAGTRLTYTVLADPYVLPEAIDGWFYMVANAVIAGEPDDQRGCTGLLRSRDGRRWEDCGILAAPRQFDRLETPQLWRHGQRWYLYVGAAREKPVYRANFLYIADSLHGPFVPAPRAELKLPDGRGFYIAKVVQAPDGRDVLLACLGASSLSRPYRVTYEPDGSLSLSLPGERTGGAASGPPPEDR